MSTSQFKIVFTRYSDTERVISTPQLIQAANFKDAMARTSDRLEGMKQAAPDAEFDIVSIKATGYIGEQSIDRINGIFITADDVTDDDS